MEILYELGSLPHFDYNLGENFWEVEPCGQSNVVTNIYDRPLKAYTRKEEWSGTLDEELAQEENDAELELESDDVEKSVTIAMRSYFSLQTVINIGFTDLYK